MAPLDGLAAVHFTSEIPGGQQCVNTFHISNPGAGSPPAVADLADLATELDTVFNTVYRDIIPTTGSFLSIKVAQVPDPTIPHDAYADYILPINQAGLRTLSNESSPAQACIVLSLKSNSGQRSYRGHLFCPPGQEARELAGNAWNSGGAYYLACEGFAAILQTGCFGSHSWTGSKLSSYYLVIYSKTLQSRAQPSVTNVVNVVTNSAVHWLRSRARGTT